MHATQQPVRWIASCLGAAPSAVPFRCAHPPTHPPTHSPPPPAGQSKPFPPKVLRKHMAWLTSEQAMADYATLIWELKEELQDPDVPVIGFGG